MLFKKNVYKFLPALVFFPKTILINFGGITLGPFIFILEKYKNNNTLLEHELIHVKQFYRTFGMFCILYLVSKRKRLEYEVEAYQRSLEIRVPSGNKSERESYAKLYAIIISEKYMVGVDKDTITKMILGYI